MEGFGPPLLEDSGTCTVKTSDPGRGISNSLAWEILLQTVFKCFWFDSVAGEIGKPVPYQPWVHIRQVYPSWGHFWKIGHLIEIGRFYVFGYPKGFLRLSERQCLSSKPGVAGSSPAGRAFPKPRRNRSFCYLSMVGSAASKCLVIP
jgi:hypothetical protein